MFCLWLIEIFRLINDLFCKKYGIITCFCRTLKKNRSRGQLIMDSYNQKLFGLY